MTNWFNETTSTIGRPYGRKAAEYFSVSADWLMSGTGERYLTERKTADIRRTADDMRLFGIPEYEIKEDKVSGQCDFVRLDDSHTA